MIYKRGKQGIYWYRFRFAGRMIHESTRTQSKTLAREAERQRRRELETKWNHVERRTLPPTLERASSAWLALEKPHLAKRTYEIYEVAVRCHLVPALGPRLLWNWCRCHRIISSQAKGSRRFGPHYQQGASGPSSDIKAPQALGVRPRRREVRARVQRHR